MLHLYLGFTRFVSATLAKTASWERIVVKPGRGRCAQRVIVLAAVEKVPFMKLCVRIIQDERGGFTAVCPSLPGCISRGQTREEARERLDEAIRGYIASINNFVPEHLDHEVIEA